MLFQQLLVALIAIGAAVYLTSMVIRSFRADKGCEGACKCSPAEKTGIQ